MANEERQEPARKARQKEIIVVGEWVADGRFVPCDKQPPVSTELNAVLAWCRKNMPAGNKFEFIRRIPGVLEMREETVVKSSFA